MAQLNNIRLAKSNVAPSDPWTYIGPKGRYILSSYHEPSLRLSWVATFLLTCMGDIMDAIARQGYRPDQPYPDGVYSWCV